MKDTEILDKAIRKANANSKNLKWFINYPFENRSWYKVIFDHDFAKAFWGEEFVCKNKNNERMDDPSPKYHEHEEYGVAWKYHLQQMVLEENPLKYLERFI